MTDIDTVARLARRYDMPFEDVLFIALNANGVNLECSYNRMRTALRLTNAELFGYASERNELDYYFAVPINNNSPFRVMGNQLSLQEIIIGRTIGLTEDICDSHYPRRNGTSINLNPNTRTSCHGCKFCYTAYQVPCDRKKLKDADDLEAFFNGWMQEHCLSDLSNLIQVSVVTGCYQNGMEICTFLLALKSVLSRHKFKGSIFYLGSQISTEKELSCLTTLRPFSICYSLETFERRELLRDKKRSLTIQRACELMDCAKGLRYETSFSYIVGIESLDVIEKYLGHMKEHVNKFPIVNTLQLHKYHEVTIADPAASNLDYYLKTRKLFERIFSDTKMRPLVWENYRSLWFLKFGNEPLYGIRTP
ncbi:MAG: hypothetical protein WCW03_01830 [Candidatus Paceibacterota bacterium]|jgi:hypothetical protein